MEVKDKLLNKTNTKMLHGLAILMMIYNHLFLDGNIMAINEGISILNIFNFINIGNAQTAQLTFAWFCRICVGIFAFTSGYGMYIQLDNKVNGKLNFKKMYKYCLKRLLSFYKVFVVCFLFFNLIIMFEGTIDFDFSFDIFIPNLLGFRTDYNSTLWYIPVYYLMILLAPIIYSLLNNKHLKKIIISFVIICFVVIGIVLVTGNIYSFYKAMSGFIQSYFVCYIVIFVEGMICGKYPIIDTIASKLNILTSVILVIVVYIVRSLIIRAPSDWLFDVILTLPFVIGITKLFSYSNVLVKGLSFIGIYSSYMWYSHSYFYAYLFNDLVIHNDISFFVYIQVVIYSLVCGILFSFVIKKIEKLFKQNRKINENS